MVKKQQNKKETLKKAFIFIGIGAMISAVTWLSIDRFKAHEMVCQVVGVDQENAIVGVRCITR